MAEDLKTSTLIAESNRIVDAINAKKNTFIGDTLSPGPIPQLRTAFGLTKPIILTQVQSLTKTQQGALLKALGSAITAIGENIAVRELEPALVAGGFLSISDAINQAPTLIGTRSADVINAMQKTQAIYTVTDAFVDANFLYSIMSKIDSIEDALVDAASTVKRV